MRILYVTTISNTVNAFLVPHIKLLISKGYQVDIATNIVEEINEDLTNMGCEIFQVSFNRKPISKSNYSAYKTLKKIMMNNYDIIHTHTPVASFITRIVCMFTPRIKSKIYYTAHGFHFYEGASFLNWVFYYPLEKFFSNYTDVLITINEEDYQLAKKRFSNPSIKKMSGVGIDLKNFKKSSRRNLLLVESLGITSTTIVLTYVAELNENKNQILLLKTILNLIELESNYLLILVGEGPNQKTLEEFIKENNLTSNVLLLGKRSDVKDLLNITDIYLASSKREGLPVNIMEAMAMELPIIATQNRGHSELVKNLRNGFIIKEYSPQVLAETVRNLHQDRELLLKIAENNPKDVSKYSIDKVLEELENIYSSGTGKGDIA